MTNGEKFKEVFGFGADGSRVIAVNATWWDCEFQNRKPITNADSFRVEEAYNWRDDIMEITRQIIHETDEARLNNIAEHFEVDLSEIRELIETKREKMQKPQTNAMKIRSMTDEELVDFILMVGGNIRAGMAPDGGWLEWLRQEAT